MMKNFGERVGKSCHALRCHGLVPWSLTLTAIQASNNEAWMPRACPVEVHVRRYVASSVRLHGTSPWHLVLGFLGSFFSSKRETPRGKPVASCYDREAPRG